MLTALAIVTTIFLIGAIAACKTAGVKSFIPATVLVVLTVVGYLNGLRFSF
jgi:hypothetical protein